MDQPSDPTAAAWSEIAANLRTVGVEIARAEAEAGRAPGSVSLVAVSKTQPVARLEQALAAGQRVFGENRVQEAKAKWPDLRAHWPELRLHLIGPLQTNKVKEALALFDVIETLDRPKLAEALAKELARAPSQTEVPVPEFLVEVNTGEEAQKAGIPPAEADAFIALCRQELHLPVTGVMAIPPYDEEPSLHFALLADIAARNGLPKVSMGMSADYPVAIRFGATHVRVGTAIFGPRLSGPTAG